MQRPDPKTNARSAFFSEKNYNTLQTVLVQDFQERNGELNAMQMERLTKTLDHYIKQVYEKQGEKPLPLLNREVLSTCSKDFSQYLQRKEVIQHKHVVKTVMDDQLFQETSQRFERINQERNEVKALAPTIPDFRISLSEDGPPAAEMYERAKKMREMEALRANQSSEMRKAEAGLQGRIQADSSFRAQQDMQNKNTEIVLSQRAYQQPQPQQQDTSLVVMPDRRNLLIGPVGSFDTMNGSNEMSQMGQMGPMAAGNPTISVPLITADKNILPQQTLIREESVVSYREVENNLFLYSGDRDWLRNNKENRYNFTVNFDPAANGQSFGPTLASQQKFKNIVRIELVKVILPGESLNVTIARSRDATDAKTSYKDNVLNLPFITLRVAELENNNYGTDNFLDRSFGVLQYDSNWVSDDTQLTSTKGFLAMIPKFLKCQKEYYPTPLSTLQKMSIDLRRPNGDLVSVSPDTFDLGGIIAPQYGEVFGPTFPFINSIKYPDSSLKYNLMYPDASGYAANFYINTKQFFSKFEISAGDRIQISGYSYSEDVLNDPTYGQNLRAFSTWVNRPEGHIVLDVAHGTVFNYSSHIGGIKDGVNEVGYANFIVIQARYMDPITGNINLNPFADDIGAVLNTFGANLQSPARLINLNKQINVVFRIITREMDSLPQLRPNNNY